ncbi:interferon-inducible GTPase 5-like [Gigantopelta aegis]|uniref:interferon-inducible GTPase 5-like n=1 Tax=Gigantopelta aegis TaxID=1735272 RepID=UPI001B88BBD9|nr:interferon-inducible GTPase 5-like [Gigantopelta aegis]
MADDSFGKFSEQELQEAKQYVDAHGVSGIVDFINDKANQWRYIGIIGESAVGKSSFINCIRDVTADDIGGAAVGTGNTTTEPTWYCHPYNEELVFWDLPGVGTPKYPRNEKYLDSINFEKYDFFLILSDSRFSTNDVWLAKEIDKRGKRFFFVSAKIDEAMENEQEIRGEDFSASAVLDKINKDCQNNFKVAQLTDTSVFCISNYHREMWQFEELMEQLIVALPEMKRISLVLSIGPVSKQVIGQKTKILKDRIWKMSTLSALAAAGGALVPIPLVGGAIGVAVDLGILIAEVNFYLKQYGLNDESLKQLADRTNTTVDYYIKSLTFASSLVTKRQTIKTFVFDVIKRQATKQVQKTAARELAKFIPIIGSVVAGGVSFGTCYYILEKTIKEFEADALSVVGAAIQQTSSQI